MLLKNFIKMQGAALFGKPVSSQSLYVTLTDGSSIKAGNVALGTVIVEQGNEPDKNTLYSILPTIYSTPGEGVGLYDLTVLLAVILGTGTTPVTFEDHCLQSPIWLDFVSHSMNTGIGSGSVTDIWQNNTDAPVTINEIGLACVRGGAGSNSQSISSSYSRVVQISRTVLGTPITLAPSEQRAFTITLNMNALDTVAVNV